ncbi:MAG TPA: hypothetical protein VG713_07485 [Pirellulales bacterium]|nr:hypothetical protein [Pirellulales bacterium]
MRLDLLDYPRGKFFLAAEQLGRAGYVQQHGTGMFEIIEADRGAEGVQGGKR